MGIPGRLFLRQHVCVMRQTDLRQLPVFFGKLGIRGGQGFAFHLGILDVLLQRPADDFMDRIKRGDQERRVAARKMGQSVRPSSQLSICIYGCMLGFSTGSPSAWAALRRSSSADTRVSGGKRSPTRARLRRNAHARWIAS